MVELLFYMTIMSCNLQRVWWRELLGGSISQIVSSGVKLKIVIKAKGTEISGSSATKTTGNSIDSETFGGVPTLPLLHPLYPHPTAIAAVAEKRIQIAEGWVRRWWLEGEMGGKEGRVDAPLLAAGPEPPINFYNNALQPFRVWIIRI
ncbi:hypothetical protein Ancab_030265 [Ancistrocladus abbreviatus]